MIVNFLPFVFPTEYHVAGKKKFIGPCVQQFRKYNKYKILQYVLLNPLNTELNPICQ